MKIYNSYSNRPQFKGEICGGDEVVERSGYRSEERQINDLLNNGKRLIEGRKFDSDNENYDETVDPTRAPGFDLSDLTAITERLDAKLKIIKATLKKKAALDAAEKEKGEEEPKLPITPPPVQK